MADSYRASPLSVRLSQEDREWLAKCAQHEDVNVHELVEQAVQHFRYWQEEGEEALERALEIFEDERKLRAQSRRLHDMLRDERHRRWEQESQLRDEHKLRVEYEKQLRDEHMLRIEYERQLRDGHKRQARAAGSYRNARYDPTVAKLLALAIDSESDSEAMAAFAKARSLHHQERGPGSTR